ncbi:Crp/Fnr family transcriptional regulator [bacterium]|nr:Crp/Fnr family transcriptional regulator [bacterium]NCQ55283.1 Crp/Fnr family transcriptional regulator [Candidatus Parcubacteria bacterium]NCS67204.1 Crp/Fnr family transcriptional regulator [Candidatus Peregrinibacteria bacterium]NCS96459.1 Crp/Fnr family transcriptional regulator [bacterium]
MDNTVFCLRNLNVLEGLSPMERLKSAPQMKDEVFQTGSTIYEAGEEVPFVYVLTTGGEVELIREENGKTVVIETLFSGDLFGDFGLGIPVNHSARVSKTVSVCKTPKQDFLDLVRSHPEMIFQLMQVMAKRTHDYEEKIAQLSRPAKDQLLAELRSLQYKNNHSLVGRIFNIPFRISHQKLSDKTGLNRVTVTKLMGELRRDNLIDVDEATGTIKVQ